MRSNIEIVRGKTHGDVIRWEQPVYVYKPITAISKAGAARIAAAAHGIKDGWRVAVTSVVGMTRINASAWPPEQNDFHRATVIDADTVELNDINASLFGDYVSGGYLVYRLPVDLTGYTARMAIKDSFGGTELLRLTTENGGIVIDAAACMIARTITAAQAAALPVGNAVFDLELVSPGGVVTMLDGGAVRVLDEVTT